MQANEISQNEFESMFGTQASTQEKSNDSGFSFTNTDSIFKSEATETKNNEEEVVTEEVKTEQTKEEKEDKEEKTEEKEAKTKKVKKTTKFLFVKFYPSLKRGAEVYVPLKPVSKRLTPSEVFSLTGTFVSMAALIFATINTTK